MAWSRGHPRTVSSQPLRFLSAARNLSAFEFLQLRKGTAIPLSAAVLRGWNRIACRVQRTVTYLSPTVMVKVGGPRKLVLEPECLVQILELHPFLCDLGQAPDLCFLFCIVGVIVVSTSQGRCGARMRSCMQRFVWSRAGV